MAANLPDPEMTAEKEAAASWFRQLRDEICAAFERIEDEGCEGPGGELPAGRFELRQTRRTGADGSEGGGGLMSVMREGRVFEKVGVNVSAVHGTLSEPAMRAMTAARDLPGLAEDPRFWASGVSLVAHMRNPKVPAVHMNTRMFWTPSGWWFGGGTDLNPAIPFEEDTAHFHRVLEETCNRHDPAYYPRFKAWADEYFFIRHRGRPRGVGGIFYDDLNTGDWQRDFAFTQDVGRAFLEAFVPLVERRRNEHWGEADREAQLVHRGLYAEFNLVYDRGTKFGLETGHDVDAVLMSMPPLARWP